MNKDDILGYVMIIFILIISYKLYIDSDYFQLKCILWLFNQKQKAIVLLVDMTSFFRKLS